MMIVTCLSLLVWCYLLLGHGRFWQSAPVLPARQPRAHPPAAIVVPARNEAPFIAQALTSLLTQDYPGPYRVILVDDDSQDATAEIARRLDNPRLTIVTGEPRPAGWSGKLWAMAQGIRTAGDAELFFLTDADIVHAPGHLSALAAQIEQDDLDMVSEMVELPCSSRAERALIPAFVFFFQLLYPFAWVNDPLRPTAAAAGGTILIRRRALDRIGGIATVRGALIDDVALAKAVKGGGKIWLGHSALARSIRPYPTFADIWRLIVRTAYVQLRFSPIALLATTLGMALVWLVPPAATLFGDKPEQLLGLAAWIVSGACFLPTLRHCQRSWLWAPILPLVALFYMAATVASAIDHHRGRGVAWKNRVYAGHSGT
jgi:hopene-associated glycosyltransferase HpnB